MYSESHSILLITLIDPFCYKRERVVFLSLSKYFFKYFQKQTRHVKIVSCIGMDKKKKCETNFSKRFLNLTSLDLGMCKKIYRLIPAAMELKYLTSLNC